jgi:hypothetical protein
MSEVMPTLFCLFVCCLLFVVLFIDFLCMSNYSILLLFVLDLSVAYLLFWYEKKKIFNFIFEERVYHCCHYYFVLVCFCIITFYCGEEK